MKKFLTIALVALVAFLAAPLAADGAGHPRPVHHRHHHHHRHAHHG
jgi:hypothetical protein